MDLLDEKPDIKKLRRRFSRSRSRSPRRHRDDRDSPSRSSDNSKMVYISNIPYDIRWMELKDIIREKAGDVSFVEMLDGADGKPKGCAVVEFKDRDTATKCVEVMHRLQLKDRNLVVKEIRDPDRFFRRVKEETGVDFLANRSGSQSIISPSHAPSVMHSNFETYGLSPAFLKQLGIEGPLCGRVFAANLPYHIGPSKLKELFGLAGTVVDIDLQLDVTGKNKGLAVIEFSHPIEAVQAISMLHNQRFHDRSITVKMDKFDKPQEPRRPGELPAGLKSIGMGLGANGAPLRNIAQLLGTASPTNGSVNTHNSAGLSVGAGASIVGGSNQLGLADLMNNKMSVPNLYSGNVGSGNTNAMSSSSLSGFGASTLSGTGSGLYGGAGLSGLIGNSAGNAGNLSHINSSSLGSGMGGFGTGSLGSSALDTGGYRGNMAPAMINPGTATFDRLRDYDRSISPMSHGMRHSRSIIIRNLPLDYSWQTLRDRLRGFGEVEYADIVSPGVGRVRFKTANVAEKAAINLNGLIVENAQITVDLVATD